MDKIAEKLVHHSLECGRRVGKTEEHDCGFEKTGVGAECGLPFVAFTDADVVIAPTNVQLGEVTGAFELVEQLLDERKRVAVLDRHIVKLAVVLDGAERTILLFNEEKRRGHRRLGRTNAS